MTKRWLRLFLLGLVLVWGWLGSPLPVQAASPRYVQAALVSEVQSVQPGQAFWVGLQLQITPGWHVYWQNPGDSGDRVRLNWQLAPGFTAGEMQWPYPERFPVGPLMNFGYKNQVLLLTQITPPADLPPGQTVDVRAQANWLVCREDCVPEATQVRLTLPVAKAAVVNPLVTAAFQRVRDQHPQPAPWPVVYAVDGEQLKLTLPIGGVNQAVFFPLSDGVITNAAPQTLTKTGQTTALTIERGYQENLTTIAGVVVLTKGQGTQAYTIQAKPGVSPMSVSLGNLGQILGLGFLGGLVLNVMPCVLPILSLKTLQLAEQARQSPRQVRLNGLSYGAGVLVSFLALAGGLFILRGLGQQLGWGFQLQSPGMVLVLMYVLFGVALNLSGVFSVSGLGAGQSLTERRGYVGEFFTGVLATVAATPCTAPFMATAIGAALTLPTAAALGVFASLGVGFALPYVGLCFVPGWRKWLPKPGLWMDTLQKLLAFPLYGTTAWLLWVLTLQTGTDGLAVGLTGLVLLGLTAWVYGYGQHHNRWRTVSIFSTLLILSFCLTLPGWLPNGNTVVNTSAPQTQTTVWEPFSLSRLQELRQQGRPVFVNFTAAWCTTCQVNERLVFNRPEVQQAFSDRGVTLLKADWTRQNPEITQVLQGFGRSGVPLYVLYPRENQPPVVWPSQLDAGQVMELLSSQPGG